MALKLACLCPTYKRPDHLRNALACFIAQDYDPESKRLFIIDDANQFEECDTEHYHLMPMTQRFATLPAKFNAIAAYARLWQADAYVVWEDDDVFLPHHLKQIEQSLLLGAHYIRPPVVYSNYGQLKGHVQLERATGRFHSSWAYSAEFFDGINGYPMTSRLDFDQQMGALGNQYDPTLILPPDFKPSYVYRWGNGLYHGSQAGEKSFQEFWMSLAKMPARYQGMLKPVMDEETQILYKSLSNIA